MNWSSQKTNYVLNKYKLKMHTYTELHFVIYTKHKIKIIIQVIIQVNDLMWINIILLLLINLLPPNTTKDSYKIDFYL